jgi:hypothetical protein
VDDVREQLLIQRLIGRRLYGIYVPPHEIRIQYRDNPDTFAEEARVSYKVLMIDSNRAGGSTSAKEMADAIHRQLVLGGDFDALCRAYRSVAPDPDKVGGIVANAGRGRLPPAADRILFDPSFQLGSWTPVLPNHLDWAIYLLLDRQERRMKDFEDSQLQQGIHRDRLHAAFRARRMEILQELFHRACVEGPPGLFPADYLEKMGGGGKQ